MLRAAGAAALKPAPAPPLVVISIDGLHPSYVLEADRFGLRVENLRRLLREGAHATAVTGVMPTVTYPSHTTLVTGVSPARHGIATNNTFDPLGRNEGGWYWYAEDIQVETLWDVATRAGLVASAVDWPVTVGARLAWNIPQVWRASPPDDSKLSRALATAGLLKDAEAAIGPWPAGYAYEVGDDEKKAKFDAWVIEMKKPRLHLAYFSGLDEEQHESAPFTAKVFATLERIDALVGALRAAAEKAGGGPATVAVVSDHGHTPDLPAVDASFFIAGPGVPAGLDLGRIDMRDVAPTLAGRLGLKLPAAEGRDRLATAP